MQPVRLPALFVAAVFIFGYPNSGQISFYEISQVFCPEYTVNTWGELKYIHDK